MDNITGLGGIGNINAETLAPEAVRLINDRSQTSFFGADRLSDLVKN